MAKAKPKAKVVKLQKSAKPKAGVKLVKTKTAAKPVIDLKNVKPVTEKQTKSQLIQFVAEHTMLTKQNVVNVFKALAVCVHGQMKKRGFGEIVIPEIGVKVRRIRKPASKEREMISPFTGQPIVVKAKPARSVVKVSALKSLKESVSE